MLAAMSNDSPHFMGCPHRTPELLEEIKRQRKEAGDGTKLESGTIRSSPRIVPLSPIITVQKQMMTGVSLILLFAVGHCLPIAVAGSSTATVKRLTASAFLGQGSLWFRKGAGAVIAGLGCYFVAKPFL
jgi:hypothetical protein